MPHLRLNRVRMRLTLLYGALFTISGAILLAITYLLVSRSPKIIFTIDIQNWGPVSSATPNGGGHYLSTQPPIGHGRLDDLGRKLREQAVRQHEADLHHLLVQSGIALAIMVLISIVLGWLVAGRILRPLRTMTATIQQISARNLHERLAAEGPRDEMKDLSDTVDGLLGRLETALDAQKRFVANAAHELRTPLTLEHALVEETLIDRGATLHSFRSTFERVLVICKQQGQLLESLLTLASSERGLDRREPVDLSLITEQVLLASRREPDRSGLLIEADIATAPISGDPALVERLVANLLDNARNYNIPGGRVEVTTGTRAGRAVISVANTGKDVPPEQVDRLFEPFQRLDRTAGREGHYGLGLSIVRAIATAHEASIVAHARPDGGLSVEVTFPPPVALFPSSPSISNDKISR